MLLSAGGAAIGWWGADPIVGLAITAAILVVLTDAVRQVYQRLMDAVNPALVDQGETTLRATSGVASVGAVHLRWIGHRFRAECDIEAPADLTVVAAHALAVQAEHRLIHAVPRLTSAIVHTDPHTHDSVDHHADLAHHRPA